MFLATDIGDMLSELWDYLSDTYFNISAADYEHLGITPTATTVSLIVIGMIFGIAIASVVAVLQKNVAGKAVRGLLAAEAHSVKNAKSLDELGFGTSFTVKNALRRNLVVRKIIKAVPVDEKGSLLPPVTVTPDNGEPYADDGVRFLSEMSPAFNTAKYKYFIPEELKNHAYFRFRKSGTNWMTAVLTIVLSVVFVFVLLRLMPDLLQILDNFMGALS